MDMGERSRQRMGWERGIERSGVWSRFGAGFTICDRNNMQVDIAFN